MGSNIGTCVTSSIVALTQVAEKNVFRRTFANAMVLYIFNFLTCVILLPVEVATGYLYHLTKVIVDSIDLTGGNPDEPQFLKVITQPLIKSIIDVSSTRRLKRLAIILKIRLFIIIIKANEFIFIVRFQSYIH